MILCDVYFIINVTIPPMQGTIHQVRFGGYRLAGIGRSEVVELSSQFRQCSKRTADSFCGVYFRGMARLAISVSKTEFHSNLCMMYYEFNTSVLFLLFIEEAVLHQIYRDSPMKVRPLLDSIIVKSFSINPLFIIQCWRDCRSFVWR